MEFLVVGHFPKRALYGQVQVAASRCNVGRAHGEGNREIPSCKFGCSSGIIIFEEGCPAARRSSLIGRPKLRLATYNHDYFSDFGDGSSFLDVSPEGGVQLSF